MLRAVAQPLPPDFQLSALAAGAWADSHEVAWLGGSGGPAGLSWEELVAFDEPRSVFAGGARELDALLRALEEPVRCDAPELAFAACAVGYLTYECGRFFERLPAATPQIFGIPDARFVLPAAVAVRDAAGLPHLLVIAEDDFLLPVRARRAHALTRRLHALGQARRAAAAPTLQVRPGWTRDEYISAIRRTIAHIAAGDIYQANVSQRFDAFSTGDPLDVHLRLLEHNPSPFAAFIGFGDRAIVSASPELFLRRRGATVETRPIKGTRRRTGDPAADATACAELAGSEKDAAELAMILDLERNDLSRVCRAGSVRVVSAAETETYATVFHRVAIVNGTLRAEASLRELLAATFPGGSITGCPKIRAVEILHELEREPRGPCFGAIGRVSHGGDLDLNVAIRTLTFARAAGETGISWNATFRTGGGIVADSDPQAEYAESLAKARALAAALGDPDLEVRTCLPPS